MASELYQQYQDETISVRKDYPHCHDDLLHLTADQYAEVTCNLAAWRLTDRMLRETLNGLKNEDKVLFKIEHDALCELYTLRYYISQAEARA